LSKWEMVRLGDVVYIDKRSIQPESIDPSAIFIGLDNIVSNSSEFSSLKDVKSSDIKSNKYVFTKKHILYGKLRPNLNKVVTPDFDGVCSTDIYPILVNEKMADKQYIYHTLHSPKFVLYTTNKINGANLPRVNGAIINNYNIPLPPLDEQKRIADVLDKASELIKKRKEQIRLMDELAKSLFIEMFGDPVENPMGWTLYLIKDLANPEKNSIKAGPFGSSLKKEFYVTQGYKIYGQEQVISGDIDFGDYYISEDKYLELKSYSIKENDVLISLVGTYGKLLIIPHIFRLGIINPRLMKVSFDLKRIMPIYFKFFFESESLKKSLAEKSHGGTMDILNVGIIKMINIPLPPLSLQQEFADRIDAIEQQKALLQDGLAKMETAYKALMQEYFG